MNAKHRTRLVTAEDVARINIAGANLQAAIVYLRAAQAGNAANYVARALKSVEGALRHARGRLDRERVANQDQEIIK